jgi:hypothetical protein
MDSVKPTAANSGEYERLADEEYDVVGKLELLLTRSIVLPLTAAWV